MEGRRQEIAEIYSHCHTFLEDSHSGPQMAEWTSWLDRASVNRYPLAQAEKATLLRNAALISELSTDPSVRPDAEAKIQEQELALSALRSEDPGVLWMMSGLVEERQLPQENVGTIPGAWQLLACNRGYDCSAAAEWLQKACSLTTTCIPGESGLEYLKNSLGTNFEQAQRIAQDIDARIRAKDWNSLPQYLWATGPN